MISNIKYQHKQFGITKSEVVAVYDDFQFVVIQLEVVIQQESVNLL